MELLPGITITGANISSLATIATIDTAAYEINQREIILRVQLGTEGKPIAGNEDYEIRLYLDHTYDAVEHLVAPISIHNVPAGEQIAYFHSINLAIVRGDIIVIKAKGAAGDTNINGAVLVFASDGESALDQPIVASPNSGSVWQLIKWLYDNGVAGGTQTHQFDAAFTQNIISYNDNYILWLKHRREIGGTLTLEDVTSVTLADPDGTYGIKKASDNTVVVAANTALTKQSTGVYYYDASAALTSGTVYLAYFKVTSGDVVEYVQMMIPAQAGSHWIRTIH